jgi:hypothetical protein
MAANARILRHSGRRLGAEKDSPDWRDWRSEQDSNPRYSADAADQADAFGVRERHAQALKRRTRLSQTTSGAQSS